METLLIFRGFFQLGNQFVSGFTYLYSFIFYSLFLSSAVKGRIRFSKLEIITFCYFVLSVGVSALNSSVSTVVSQFNKLFLCLLIIKVSSGGKLEPHGKPYSYGILMTIAAAFYVCMSLLASSSYSLEWGTKTFLMTFTSQHETAQFIVLLVASIGFDLVCQGERSRVIKTIEVVLMSILMYALLMTGARTITLCGVAIYAFLLSKLLRNIDAQIRPIVVAIIALVAIMALAPHLSETVFFEKNSNLASSSFTNGREDIWSYYGKMYMEQPLFEQIFGSGVGLISERSMLSIGTHNDILTFLLSYGVIGLVLYISYVLRNLWNRDYCLQSLALIAAFLFCALSNGFAGYTELVCAFALLPMVNSITDSHVAKTERPLFA